MSKMIQKKRFVISGCLLGAKFLTMMFVQRNLLIIAGCQTRCNRNPVYSVAEEKGTIHVVLASKKMSVVFRYIGI